MNKRKTKNKYRTITAVLSVTLAAVLAVQCFFWAGLFNHQFPRN